MTHRQTRFLRNYILIATQTVIGFSILAACASSSQAQQALCVNALPDEMPALARAAEDLGVQLSPWDLDASAPQGKLLIWEADSDGVYTTKNRAKQIEAFVKEGGGLLLSLSKQPSICAFRLAPILPATAYQSFFDKEFLNTFDVGVSDADETFFDDAAALSDLTLPYFYKGIRPVTSAERAIARYEQYNMTDVPLLKDDVYSAPQHLKRMKIPLGSRWWTRVLWNRQWQVRLWGNDLNRTPLLITGRTGAGRVALLNSTIKLPNEPATRILLSAVLKWLTQPTPAPCTASPHDISTEMTVDASSRTLHLAITNTSTHAVDVEAVARLMTWEQAPIKDLNSQLSIPAQTTERCEWKLPVPSATEFQALDAKDSFFARMGILSGDGRTLLWEMDKTIELDDAPVQLRLQTGELSVTPHAFEQAITPETQGLFHRMGIHLDHYVFRPGQEIETVAVVSNGLRNLAPLAHIVDEKDPNNDVHAVADGAAVHVAWVGYQAVQSHGFYAPGESARANGRVDTSLRFEFPRPVTVAGVVVSGWRSSNPEIVSVEINGEVVAEDRNASRIGQTSPHRLELDFAPVDTRMLRLHLSGASEFRIGEVEILGAEYKPKPVEGEMQWTLVDVLQNTEQRIEGRPVTVPAFARQELPIICELPSDQDKAGVFRLEGRFVSDGRTVAEAALPMLTLSPQQPLRKHACNGPRDMRIGPIGTSGYRELVPYGTGLGRPGGWDCPESQIWAYSRRLIAHGEHDFAASSLYSSWAIPKWIWASPWQPTLSGDEFVTRATTKLIEHRLADEERFNQSDTIHMHFSDYWCPSPFAMAGPIYTWPRFEAFHAHLLSQSKAGLTGQTKQQIIEEINTRYRREWDTWCIDRYVESLEGMRDAFAAAGKRFELHGQLWSCYPPSVAERLFKIITNSNDDSTWDMWEASIPLTTGRLMSQATLAPGLQMEALLMWGFDNQEYIVKYLHFQHPVVTEPARRHNYTRAFRGIVKPDGSYSSVHTFGFGRPANLGPALAENDFVQFQRMMEKFQFIDPTAPLGAGLVLSSSYLDQPEHYKAYSIRTSPMTNVLSRSFRRLHEAGLSIPFTMNAAFLDRWKGDSPLILVNLEDFTEADIQAVRTAQARGVRFAAMCGAHELKPSAAAVFGVTTSGQPERGKVIARLDDRPVVATYNTVFVPIAGTQLDEPTGRCVAEILEDQLRIPIHFPVGFAGYAFRSSGRTFLVVEDWTDVGGVIELRIKANPDAKTLRAVDTDDHVALKTQRDGESWVIETPMRPADGKLIMLEEY